MTKTILILGASGTVGTTVFKQLSLCEDMKVFGTYFSAMRENDPFMIRFSVESPDDIRSVLRQVRPNVVISSLRGDFEKQLKAHEIAAKYLRNNNGKMLFLSTANVFDGSLDRPYYETDTPISSSDYGQFKIQCEDMLRDTMGDRTAVLRLPFVWGRSSPRLHAVKDGCEAGRLEIYSDFSCNHVSDMQIVDFIGWMIREDKSGIFHVGTSDVTDYPCFIERLIAEIGMEQPELVAQKVSGVMAVLSSRDDIPDNLKWDSKRLIRYLCGKDSVS